MVATCTPKVSRLVQHRRNWTCIYPDARNVHLVKDIGMIANVMARSCGYESHFVCLDRERDFSYARDETRWLALQRLPDEPGYRQFRWPPRAVIRHVWKNARRIQVLLLFNHTRETMILGLLYKLLNPRGFLYLKLDANETWLEGEVRRKESSWFVFMHDFLLPQLWATFVPDLLTAESEVSMRNYLRLHPWCRKRLKLLPNGVDDTWLSANGFGEIDREGKEDLMIYVGRIGTEQKNTEMLLDALEFCDLGSWKVVLVGPVEESFRERVEAFFRRKPELRNKVEMAGDIRDRRDLYAWYRRAKVFCTTSRWEGFSLALIDALHFGCHIVSTPVSSIEDILDHGSIGKVVRTGTDLAGELGAIFSGVRDPLEKFDEIRAHAENFRWSALCQRLAEWVETAR